MKPQVPIHFFILFLCSVINHSIIIGFVITCSLTLFIFILKEYTLALLQGVWLIWYLVQHHTPITVPSLLFGLLTLPLITLSIWVGLGGEWKRYGTIRLPLLVVMVVYNVLLIVIQPKSPQTLPPTLASTTFFALSSGALVILDRTLAPRVYHLLATVWLLSVSSYEIDLFFVIITIVRVGFTLLCVIQASKVDLEEEDEEEEVAEVKKVVDVEKQQPTTVMSEAETSDSDTESVISAPRRRRRHPWTRRIYQKRSFVMVETDDEDEFDGADEEDVQSLRDKMKSRLSQI
jgi:hypothetical protein